jgi:hypothetical protein
VDVLISIVNGHPNSESISCCRGPIAVTTSSCGKQRLRFSGTDFEWFSRREAKWRYDAPDGKSSFR